MRVSVTGDQGACLDPGAGDPPPAETWRERGRKRERKGEEEGRREVEGEGDDKTGESPSP